MRMKRVISTIVCAAWAAVAVTAVPAASIGVHFPSDRDNARLDPADVAGLPGVVQSNWNSADGGADAQGNANGDTSGVSLPNAGMLTDSDGATVAATVQWTSNGTWNTTNGMVTPDDKLMNGYIDAIGAADPFATVSFSDIPYSQYDVYVYFGSDGNGRTGQVTDGATTFSYSTFSNDPGGGGGFDPATDYVLTDDTGMGFPDSNYAVFRGRSDPSITIETLRGSNNSGIHAVQLVETDFLTGDVNLDNVVDIFDFEIIRDNFIVGTTRAEGDLNFSGRVDVEDFRIWKDVFSPAAAPASVPEPTTMTLLVVGIVLGGFRRRRRRVVS